MSKTIRVLRNYLQGLNTSNIAGRTENEKVRNLILMLRDNDFVVKRAGQSLMQEIFEWKPKADDIVIYDIENYDEVLVEVKYIRRLGKNKEQVGYFYCHALAQKHLMDIYHAKQQIRGKSLIVIMYPNEERRSGTGLSADETVLADSMKIKPDDIIIIS